MNKYWISWVHDDKYGEFEIHSPWWCSGYDSYDNPTMCAAIKASNEEQAEEFIYNSYDKKPEHINFRFCSLKPKKWNPFCDRFPRADWMKWD